MKHIAMAAILSLAGCGDWWTVIGDGAERVELDEQSAVGPCIAGERLIESPDDDDSADAHPGEAELLAPPEGRSITAGDIDVRVAFPHAIWLARVEAQGVQLTPSEGAAGGIFGGLVPLTEADDTLRVWALGLDGSISATCIPIEVTAAESE